MLTALEEGVKGGKWYSLIDKVYLRANLRSAFAKVAENEGAAGADRQTIEMFGKELEANLERLAEEVKDGTYRPKPVRREWIDKPGSKEKRPLGIPTVRDRVVQKALLNVLEPIFERDFAAHSYGFRPRRGCKDALRRVDELLKAGYTWVVDADLKGYLDAASYCTSVCCGAGKEGRHRVRKLDSQAFSAPLPDVNGVKLAALYTLQDGLAADAQSERGFEHRDVA
jgi:RNA-directed DNA polymerase